MHDGAGVMPLDHPQVFETLGGKTLSFSAEHVQSEMSFAQPDALEFEYTRLMMGFLLWVPQPRMLGMVGLGGGSLAKYCYRYLPSARITVVEIHPGVIALRDAFQIPLDGGRFQVVCADAADYLASTDRRFDVLLVDGFNAQGLPRALSTPQFYADCVDVLSPHVVAVFNLHRSDPLFDVVCDRIAAAFGRQLCCVGDSTGSNIVAFAWKGTQARNELGACASVHARRNALDASAWRDLQAPMVRVQAARHQVNMGSML